MATNVTREILEFLAVDKTGPAFQSIATNLQTMRTGMDTVKNALAAIGVTVGVGAMLKFANDTLKATAALDDMSEATGASVESLSRLQGVARIGGHNFEALTQQIGRMVKGLKDGSDEGLASARAFELLGVKTRDAGGRMRDSGQIFIDTAKSLAGYADTAEKVQVIQAAMGKGAEQLLPYMKDIAQYGDQVGTVFKEQAEQAERLQHQMGQLNLAFAEFSRDILLSWLPPLIEYIKQLKEATAAAGGLVGGVGLTLGLDTSSLEAINRQLEETKKKIKEIEGPREERGLMRRGAEILFGTKPYDLASGVQLSGYKAQEQFLEAVQRRRMQELTGGLVQDVSGEWLSPPSLPRLAGIKSSEALAKEKRDAEHAAEDEQRRRQRLLDEDAKNWVRRIDEMSAEWMKVAYGWEQQGQFLEDAAGNLSDITKRVELTADEQERLKKLSEQTWEIWRNIDNAIGQARDNAVDLGDQLQTRIIEPTGDEARVRGLESYDERSDARIREQMESHAQARRAAERTAETFEHAVATGIMVGMRRGAGNMAIELRRIFTDAILAAMIAPMARQVAQSITQYTGGYFGGGGGYSGSSAGAGYGLTPGAWYTPPTWQEDAAGNAWQSGGGYNWGGIAAGGIMAYSALQQYRGAGSTGDPAGAKRNAGLTAVGAGIGTFFMPGVGTIVGGMAGSMLGGLLGGDGAAMRTGQWVGGLGTGGGVGEQNWFGTDMTKALNDFQRQQAAYEQNLVRNLNLTSEQQEAINARLVQQTGRYEFGMEWTPVEQSGAFQQISQARTQAIADELGRSMEELTAVMQMSAEQWELAIKQLRDAEQQAAMGIKDFANSLPEALGITQLEGYQKSLAVSPTLSPLDQLAGARAQYEDFLSRAMGGEREAIFGFPDVAQQLLGIGREFYASGEGFQDLFREVNTSLNQVLDRQREEQVELMTGLEVTMVDLREAWLEELRLTKTALVESLEAVRTELKRMQQAA